ncbi:nucleotidyltransferase family protein [Nocardioides sp. GXQ0305]|uniref:nucleotidyltransferase family protein n=1 Tax=Nocardioides sp. GXQ0305 TaxID=3423912 RepID=UPI003D7D38AD
MDVRRLLLGLAAHGLPTTVALPDEPPSGQEWRRLRSAVRIERLTGPASAAADAGALVLTDEQRQELEEEHVAAMAHVVRLEAGLLRIHDVLGAAGVPVVVLKGTAVAHLDYADPQARAFGDVDILLPTGQFAEGVAALLDHGYVRPSAGLGPGFDARFGKGATLVGPETCELDVHRTFAMGPFGMMVRLEELWEHPACFELGGRELHALDTEQRYLHACYHAVIGNNTRRVQPYRDVAEMLLYGAHDPARLRRLAAHWSAEVVLARAVVETWDALGLTEEGPLLAWARGRVPTRREERLLGVYGRGTSYAAKAVAGLTVLPGWRDRVAYARMLALPDRQHARATGGSRVGRLFRGARRVARDTRRVRTGRR